MLIVYSYPQEFGESSKRYEPYVTSRSLIIKYVISGITATDIRSLTGQGRIVILNSLVNAVIAPRYGE